MEILVPGPFVVLQGNTGDGLSNTIDGPLPTLPRRQTVSRAARRIEGNTLTAVPDGELDSNDANVTDAMVVDSQPSSPTSSLSSPEEEGFQHVARTTAAGIVSGPRYAVTAGVVAAAAAAESNGNSNNTIDANASSSSDEFVVVTDDGNNGSEDSDQQYQPTEEEMAAIDRWKASRRANELRQRTDFEESMYQVDNEIKLNHAMMRHAPTTNSTNDPQSRSWWQRDGEVAVFSKLPEKLFDGSISVDRIGTLPPGLTVVANDLIELNSTTFYRKETPRGQSQGTSDHQRLFSLGRVGVIQIIQIQTKEGHTGYVCLSLDGYPLLSPGLPDAYVNPGAPNNQDGSHASHSWIWRVTCPSGAFVREGLDLRTRHIRTLPYGSLVRVTRRCINDQGLSRLRTSGCFDIQMAHTESFMQRPSSGRAEVQRVHVDGWCSELLNPLSGQRGIVAQPLPFPVPAIYRVTLSVG